MTNACCDLSGNKSCVVGVGKTGTVGAWITPIHQFGATAAG